MSERPTELLRTESLCKLFPDGNVRAISDVSLSIREREFIAITGPSGCGKSTLLGLLGTLETPTSGSVYWRGIPLQQIRNVDALRAREIGFVFQSFHLLSTLTALENVQIPMFERGWSSSARRERAAKLLDRVSLSSRSQHISARLSVGERQRVAIARAMANEPRLILADEPTGNLDSANAEHILNLFREIHAQDQITLVLVTHSPEVAAAAHRRIRMRDGRIIGDDSI